MDEAHIPNVKLLWKLGINSIHNYKPNIDKPRGREVVTDWTVSRVGEAYKRHTTWLPWPFLAGHRWSLESAFAKFYANHQTLCKNQGEAEFFQ